MLISKTSWHYRLMLSLHDYECQIPTDLCRYVRVMLWKSFWHLVFFIFAAAFISVFAWGFLYLPIAALIGLWTSWVPYDGFASSAEAGLVVWGIYGVASVLALIAHGITTLKARSRERKRATTAETGIFVQRYRDWK